MRVAGVDASGTMATQATARTGAAGGGAATAFCSWEDARQVPQLRAAPSRSDGIGERVRIEVDLGAELRDEQEQGQPPADLRDATAIQCPGHVSETA